MEIFLNILSGGIAGGILSWLLRNWISERLKQSIQHEYSYKLEIHKAELNAYVQSIQHENQLRQLRTSLFFDHQREAFASILCQLSDAKDKWFQVANDPEGEPFIEPIPNEEYEKFKQLYYKHQLFFDADSLFAINLALGAMFDSLPVYNFDDPPKKRECYEAYKRLGFIQERMAQIFQEKIGVCSAKIAKYELSLLALMRLLNTYHFPQIGIPVEGVLRIKINEEPSEIVLKAQHNIKAMVSKAIDLKTYLSDGNGFNEVSAIIDRCFEMLEENDVPIVAYNDI